MIKDRSQYEATLAAVGVCVAARIPFLLWGDPGAGKTAVIESAARSGWHVETLICSHYEPSDFAGLPIVSGDRVTLAPPGWAARVADQELPAIVFFDEPSSGLDPITAAGVDNLIAKLNAVFGITMVVVTHDLASAWAIAGRVAVILDGEVAAIGSKEEVWVNPHPRIRDFIERRMQEAAASGADLQHLVV